MNIIQKIDAVSIEIATFLNEKHSDMPIDHMILALIDCTVRCTKAKHPNMKNSQVIRELIATLNEIANAETRVETDPK